VGDDGCFDMTVSFAGAETRIKHDPVVKDQFGSERSRRIALERGLIYFVRTLSQLKNSH
jgi:hypothetical protein